MAVAQQVLKQVIAEIPDGVEVGMRVFGHRIGEGQPGDCEDSELMVPIGPVDKAALGKRIESIHALGTTLIAYTLEQVAADLKGTADEQIVVLVTDGEEECRQDLRETVERINATGFKMSLNVVGFALGDESISADLASIAELGSGSFVAADDAADLANSLKAALRPRFSVVDADGAVVGSGVVDGEVLSVSAGVYEIVIHKPGKPLGISNVSIDASRSTQLELRKHGEIIDVRASN
jgi:hypothetical protein